MNVVILPTSPDQAGRSQQMALVYPTRVVPAEKLENLTGLVAIGGDAVADSEAVYD